LSPPYFFFRFKIGAEGPFQFSWRDLYTGAEFVVTELSYELASVLYNIGELFFLYFFFVSQILLQCHDVFFTAGALHTRLGCSESRKVSSILS
jgi:hypothetical protein